MSDDGMHMFACHVLRGLVMTINGTGMLIGPTIGGVMYEHLAYRNIFIICGAVTAVDALMRALLIDDEFLKQR